MCTSNDAQFFISTAFDGTIKVWNFTQNDCIKTLCASSAKILCSLLNANDKWIVTGSADSTARIINIDTGKTFRTFRDHTGPVVGLQLSSDDEFLQAYGFSNNAFLAVACEDETLRVFSMGYDSRVNALAASKDDCQLFVATKGRVLVYDIHNGQLLEILQCESSLPVTSLKITTDNSFVLAACGERIYMWNMNSIEREMLHNDQSTLTYVRMAPDEKGAGCGTVDGILAFWDLDSSQQKSSVTAIEFTNDSLIMISGSAAGSISVWEISTGNFIKQSQMHRAEVTQIVCFGNGNRILSCDRDANVQIWNLFLGEEPIQMDLLTVLSDVQAPLFVRHNDSVLIGHNALNLREVNIWAMNLDSQLTVKTKAYHTQEIVCYSLNRAGTTLVTGSKDESLKVWQSENGFLIQVLVGHKSEVVCCCVSESGKIVISGAMNRHMIIWDVDTGTVRQTIELSEIINNVDISQDASVIVTSSESGWIEARNRENGQLLSSFKTHRNLNRLIMNTDGNRILCQLGHTAQLPILCLHNTPASLASAVRLNQQQTTSQQQQTIRQRQQSATSSFSSNAIGDDVHLNNKQSNRISPESTDDSASRKSKLSKKLLKKTTSKALDESSTTDNSKLVTTSGSTPNPTTNKTTKNRKSNMCMLI